MRRSSALALFCVLSITFIGEAWAWGGTGHKFINGKAVIHLPASMAQLAAQQTLLVNHASDADNRRNRTDPNYDPNEEPRHFLDLENYPGFQNFPSDLNVIIQAYGQARVNTNGILPWATATTIDSLTEQFRRGDWAKAYLTAADLGHYVGDGHQPLHCTVNYDVNGVHSRYESSMINTYQGQLTVVPDSARYISDPFAYAKAYIIRNNAFADSINNADLAAKSASGGSYNTTYYATLWQLTGRLTNEMMQDATVALASLWYTAWVDAGLATTAVPVLASSAPAEFELSQNYPNPFNPTTVIRGTLPSSGRVKLSVVDLLGREVALLLDEVRPAGKYQVRFDGSRLPSGLYVYRMEAGGKALSRKMLLLK